MPNHQNESIFGCQLGSCIEYCRSG